MDDWPLAILSLNSPDALIKPEYHLARSCNFKFEEFALHFIFSFLQFQILCFSIMCFFLNLPLCLTFKSDQEVKKCAYYFHL